jgi:hypothetical protein
VQGLIPEVLHSNTGLDGSERESDLKKILNESGVLIHFLGSPGFTMW